MAKKPMLTILSGLSGSGKTTALATLEDLGFFCTDNLPAELLPQFIKLVSPSNRPQHVGVVIDARGQSYFKEFEKNLTKLKKQYNIRILYLESRIGVLVKRYTETRRTHPLSPQGKIVEGIKKEKKIISPIYNMADKIIDTSDVSVHALKALLKSYFQFLNEKKSLQITLVSFGFKYGIPIQADLVLDVRFLPNPYFVKHLKPLTGKTKSVKDFVLKNQESTLFIKKTQDLLGFLVKQYKKEGKAYLTIAFGCTGGRHRSVVMVDEFKKFFSKMNIVVSVTHRDVTL